MNKIHRMCWLILLNLLAAATLLSIGAWIITACIELTLRTFR